MYEIEKAIKTSEIENGQKMARWMDVGFRKIWLQFVYEGD